MNNKLTQRTEKPWGYEILYALTTKYAGKIIFVKKGHRLSFQYHKIKEETMYIQHGKAVMTMDGNDDTVVDTIVTTGDAIHIPPLTRHRVEALEDTTILEVSTAQLGDIVRIEDDYGRSK